MSANLCKTSGEGNIAELIEVGQEAWMASRVRHLAMAVARRCDLGRRVLNWTVWMVRQLAPYGEVGLVV
jgi:hypothetical protein